MVRGGVDACVGQSKPPRREVRRTFAESKWEGNGERSSLEAARAMMPIAVSAGGVEA